MAASESGLLTVSLQRVFLKPLLRFDVTSSVTLKGRRSNDERVAAMDIRSEKPWHVIYKDESGMMQRSGNFNSREGVLAKATFLSRTCEVVQILDEEGRTIDVAEISNWRARNLDIWATL